MAKQLNTYRINLAMTADTGQAKRQLQDLQTQLSNLMNSTASSGANNLGITKQITNATQAVAQLKVQLENATNVDTGKLDLGKFQQSLKESGMTLKDYQTTLSSLGPAGTQAFATLATSITQAEIPLRRSNELLSSLWTTMKNTARWQLTSSMLHGFQGALQTAFGYAKDLNSSLNNIRIVTGYGVDEMAQFAVEANKAAKALSTTTTEYTDAALIYYQQGLNDEQVLARTDATIKLANVSRQSAEEVSQQLTAIWNNFSDGTDNLEYYIDVITKLGATTASSSQEISDGLQKFAAVSSTVGLSYEYAAAALATVTATTRQSADVVGTAFRTLFARIEQLNLGETLDDGTTLGKYSEALMKVGVNIKDANGELKDMDDILDEIGAKWATLGRDEQVALAQSVAGIRQYTQFIALMDNWDFMEKNVETARNSTGELQRQADIYAESWEAARDRITASAESIYDALLNDKFFIELNNLGADVLDTINNIIKGVGGLKGVLTLLSGTMIMLFQDNLAKGLKDLQYNFMMLTNSGRQQVEKLRTEANQLLIQAATNSKGGSGQVLGQAYKNQADLQNAYLKSAEKMDEEQRQIALSMLDQQQALIRNIELQQQLNRENEINANSYALKAKQATIGLDNRQEIKETIDSFQQLAKEQGIVDGFFKNINYEGELTTEVFEHLKVALKDNNNILDQIGRVYGPDAANAFYMLQDALNTGNIEQANIFYREFNNILFDTQPAVEQLEEQFKIWAEELDDINKGSGQQLLNILEKLKATSYASGEGIGKLSRDSQALTRFTQDLTKGLQELEQKNISATQSFVVLAGSLTSLAASINIIKGLFKTWSDETISSGDKLLTTISSLGMAFPMLARVINKDNLINLLHALGVSSATASMGVGLLVAKLVPFIAIAAGVGLAIRAIVKAYNQVGDAAKENQQKLEESTDAVEQTRQAWDNLGNSLSQYEEGIKALDKLTRGTEEWRDKLEEVNEQVLSLIDTYPFLAEYVTNSGGQLIISQQGISELIKYQQQDLVDKRNQMWSDRLNTIPTDSANAIQKFYNNLGFSNFSGADASSKALLDLYKQQGNALFELSTNDISAQYGRDIAILFQEVTKNNENRKSFYDLVNQLNSYQAQQDLAAQYYTSSYLAQNNQTYGGLNYQEQEELTKIIVGALGDDKSKEAIEALINGADFDDFVEKARAAAAAKPTETGQTYEGYLSQQAEALEVSEDALEGYANALARSSDKLEEHSKLAVSAATANIKFSRGIDSLNKTFEEYLDVLAEGNTESFEFYEALSAIGANIEEVFGVTVSNEWVAANLDKIQKLAEGNIDVINELAVSAAHEFVNNLNIDSGIRDQFNSLLDELANDANIEIGTQVDITDSVESLNELIKAGQISAADVQKAFNAIGYEPDIELFPVESPASTTEMSGTYTTYDYNGNPVGSYSFSGSQSSTTTTQVPLIKSKDGSASVTKIATPQSRHRAVSNNIRSGGNKSSDGSSKQLDKKRPEEEIERYHQLNKELKQLETEYSRIGKLKDEAYGPNKLKYIDQEISKIQQLQSKQSQLGNAIFSNVVQDRANIEGYGFTFDDNGTITNYEEIYAKQIEIFNNELTDEAQTNFENFVKLTKQYEDSLDLYNENYDKQVELFYQELQAKLEKITVRVEAAIEINDDSIKLIDYYTKRLEDNSFSVAKALVFMGDKAKYLTDNAVQYQQGIADIMAQIEEQGGKATEAQTEQLRKYRDELLNTNLELAELTKTINEQFIVALDESNEEIEKSLKRFDNYGNVLKKYGDILKLLGKDAQNMGIQQQLAAAATANAINKLDVSRQQYDLLEEAYRQGYAEYQKALDEGNQDVINTWENNVDKLAEEVQNAYSKVLDNEVNALQAAADEFKTGVEETIKTLQRTMSEGYDTLDQLQTVYDRQKMLNDEYITENQQVHELNKLARDVDKAITDNPNLNAQKRLRDFMNDINDTYAEIGENGEYITRMSQYDLDYARKRYELLLAQIALEDARNNKTSMRLVRDNSGNYNYIYTADQSETDNAEQQYEDKLYELQKISEDRIKATSDAILQNRKNMIKAMEELNADDFASQEEYIAALESIRDDYLEHEKFLEGELSKSMNNLQNDNGTLTETIITNTIGIKNETDALEVAANEAIGKLGEHWQTLRDNVDAAVNASGGIGAEGIIPNIQSISKESDDLVKHFDEDTLPKVKKYLKDTLDAIDDWNKEWSAKTKETIGYNEKVAESINALVPTLENVVPSIETNFDKIAEAAKGAAAAAQEAARAISNLNGTRVNSVDLGNNDGDEEGTYYLTGGTTYGLKSGLIYQTSNLNGSEIQGEAEIPVTVTDHYTDSNGIKYVQLNGNDKLWVRENEIYRKKKADQYSEHFDTGGYTGQWGSDGRLAMLHEKELVLNSRDTENMLSAVQVLRSLVPDISSGLTSAALSQQGILGSIMHTAGVSPSNNTLQQMVTIDANFPGVTSAAEIESALNDIVNQAAQYASIKKLS